MAVKVRLAQSVKDKKAFANMALESNLFNPGWMLESQLEAIVDERSISFVDICLAKDGDDYIGVSLYFTPCEDRDVGWAFDEHSVICFVHQDHRRKGIGRLLINGFEVPPEHMKSYYGEWGSGDFWRKVGTNYQGCY